MTPLSAAITVPLANGPVAVRELTLGELRALMAQLAAGPGDWPLDAFLVEGWDLRELAAFVEGGAATLDGLRPSELAQVASAVQELNADFFGMRARLSAALLKAQAAPEPSLSAPSPA